MAEIDGEACPPGGETTNSWNRRGMACTRRRRFDAAIDSFGRALALEPRSVEAILGRANALYARERYGEALADYDRALELDPSRPAVHLARANALTALGRADEAADAIGRAMALRRGHKTG